jgi:hypothetical protein
VLTLQSPASVIENSYDPEERFDRVYVLKGEIAELPVDAE